LKVFSSSSRKARKEATVKIKLMFGLVFLGIVVLAIGGFTVRRTRRALRAVLRPALPAAAGRAGAPAGKPAFAA
jgi:hypothetical protein